MPAGRARSARAVKPRDLALTRPGVLGLIGSITLALVGRILGLVELYVLAGVGVALIAASVAHLLWPRPKLGVHRVVYPQRVHVGVGSRVELSVTNHGTRPSPVLTLRDQVSGTGGAQLMVSSIPPEAAIAAAYRLPTARRGLVAVGPLTLEQGDPFGLARRLHQVGLRNELTVLPRVVSLLPLPYSLGNDPLAGAEQPNHLGRGGDDFYALRSYVVGDDLRRVHWPSTARTGDLLVRQDEQPWQGRVSVLLDTRRAASDAANFEEMVTAAASIITASRRRGDLVRLCTTGGLDSGFVAGHAQIDAIMEQLAIVDFDSTGTWSVGLSRADATGSLVAIVSEAEETDLRALIGARARKQAGGLTILRIGGRRPPGPDQAPRVGHASVVGWRRGSVRMVEVGTGADLASGWNSAMRRRSPTGSPAARIPAAP